MGRLFFCMVKKEWKYLIIVRQNHSRELFGGNKPHDDRYSIA
ncbi:hypothetical protein [Ruminococcus flavefaciens]|nr:hypothetical protein [Ruminococcus flavefaciens]